MGLSWEYQMFTPGSCVVLTRRVMLESMTISISLLTASLAVGAVLSLTILIILRTRRAKRRSKRFSQSLLSVENLISTGRFDGERRVRQGVPYATCEHLITLTAHRARL